MAAVALTTALPALAQQAAPQEEIVVTGSRIARPNLTQPNPVQVMTGETIQSLGLTATVDVVNQLPQTQNNMTLSTSNRFINGAGVSFSNLRGLGEYRTLTLVDGKRHVGSLSGRNGSGGTSLVDLNQIPPMLIDRVEVVTGGASAIYGADAVAGVVNVILKKNYEGAEITTEVKATEHGGGNVFTTNGIFGVNVGSGRGNVTFGFDYSNDKGLHGVDRDYALENITLTANPANTGPRDGIPDRISLRPTLSTTVAANGAAVIKTALRGPGSQYTIAFRPDGSGITGFNRGSQLNGRPTDSTSTGDGAAIGGDGVNTSRYLTLRVPNIRTVANTLVNYQLAENLGFVKTLNFFADVKYGNSRGTTSSNPFTNGSGTPATGNGIDGISATGALVARADNPYLPADARAALAAAGITGSGTFQFTRLNDDWDSREYHYEYNVLRAVTGFNGELANGWKYEAYYNYGRNQSTLINKDRITARINQQIDSMVDPATGQIVCRDATARAQGCIPINPFRVAPLSPAQLAYAHTTTKELATLIQESAGANLTGDLFTYRTPFSGTVAPLSFAAGVEWRREFSTDTTDWLAQQTSGFIYGNQNTGPTGSYLARDAYVEFGVPVLRDLPFAKAVDLDLAYRYSKYSTSGSANTWNARAAWAVNDDLKFRGGVGRAVRTPNLDDLLTPAGDNFVGVSDVCSVENINANPNRTANCRSRGVPVGFDARNFGNPSVRTGGNPALKPEIGTSVTAGVVITPTFVPGLNITADYWWIRITQGQSAVDPNSLIRGCYDDANAGACSAITRRADGSIFRIDGTTQNLGKEIVRGLDLGVSYSFGLDRVGLKNYGDMTVGFDGSWVPENILIQNPTDLSTKLYRAGTVGYPHLKGTFRAVWDWDALAVTWQSRFVGESEMFPNASMEVADFHFIPTQWYHDLSAKYRWRNVTFFGGINNLFDNKPPQYPFIFQGSYQGGSYSTFPVTTGGGGAYDAIGRAFFAGASIKF